MRKRSAGKHTGKIGRAETDDGLARILMRKFQLHILNEALLTAHDLTASRAEAFEAADASAADGVSSVFLRDIGMTEDAPAENVYRVVVFGDGAAAQSAAGQLFVQTASVDAEGRSSLFLADVFVADARGQMGWSGVEHPLCHCVDCGEEPCLLPVEEPQKTAMLLIVPMAPIIAFLPLIHSTRPTIRKFVLQTVVQMGIEQDGSASIQLFLAWRCMACFCIVLHSSWELTCGMDCVGLE